MTCHSASEWASASGAKTDDMKQVSTMAQLLMGAFKSTQGLAPPVAILEAGARAAGSYLRLARLPTAVVLHPACLASTFHCHADTISSLQVSVSPAAMRVHVRGGMGLRRPNQRPGAPCLRDGRAGGAGRRGSLRAPHWYSPGFRYWSVQGSAQAPVGFMKQAFLLWILRRVRPGGLGQF